MFHTTTLIKNIPLEVPWIPILRRLGYRRGTEPDPASEKRIRDAVDEALMLARVQGLYRLEPLRVKKDGILIGSTHEIKSNALPGLYEKCTIVSIMAVSLGQAVCDRRDSYMIDGSPSKGVLLDAAASELAEAAVESVYQMIQTLGRQKGYTTTIRFSPGYKDVALSTQKSIDELLDLGQIGVSVTESFMLKPEKTVTAFAGWERSNE